MADPHELESSVGLLVRARAGDAAALNDLLARYLPRMRRWATGRVPKTARGLLDTQDVIQETLVTTLRHLDTFEIRGEGSLQAYLRQALANRLTDLYRREAGKPVVEDVATDMPATGPSPLEETIGVQAVERYEAALGRLRPEDREAVVLRIEMQLDYEEIAEGLNKRSAASARMAVSRALARLAQEMSRGR